MNGRKIIFLHKATRLMKKGVLCGSRRLIEVSELRESSDSSFLVGCVNEETFPLQMQEYLHLIMYGTHEIGE